MFHSPSYVSFYVHHHQTVQIFTVFFTCSLKLKTMSYLMILRYLISYNWTHSRQGWVLYVNMHIWCDYECFHAKVHVPFNDKIQDAKTVHLTWHKVKKGYLAETSQKMMNENLTVDTTISPIWCSHCRGIGSSMNGSFHYSF